MVLDNGVTCFSPREAVSSGSLGEAWLRELVR